jgi:hypothetical protein
MNDIKTWRQGHFVDQPQYLRWSTNQKQEAEEKENLNVRPGPTENAICKCKSPDDAKWIASRLNLASELEQLTWNFTRGKIDGSEIRDFVRSKIS